MVHEKRKPLTWFLVQALFGTAFTYLTSGVFLSGLAINMGAGDTWVSYLSVIVNICGILILLLAGFMERFRSRRRLAIGLTVLSRLATLLIVAIPALVPEQMRLMVFIPAVVLAFTLQAQTTVALNQWMLGFVDEGRSGRYISLRQTLTLLVTVVLSAAGGIFMDWMQGAYMGFVIVFSAAALMGICEIVVLLKTPDGVAYKASGPRYRLSDMIRIPMKDRSYLEFVLYIAVFYFLLYIADSFTMVYMMKYLAMPYGTVTMMYMLISLPQVILLSMWGTVSDRMGHNAVLKASVWFFAGETLFLFFASPQSCYVFIPAAFLTASVANSGFVVAVFNRRYELMPEGNRIVYDNFYTAAVGIGSILGPVTGGILKRQMEAQAVLAQRLEFADIRLLYLISTAGILLLQVVCVLRQRRRRQLCSR